MKHIEDNHQKALFTWANTQKTYPELSGLFAIPNGGFRNAREGARMKAQGVKAGFPDIGLLVARNGYHGLFIELKRPIVKGTVKPTVSKEQTEWLARLNFNGYKATVCFGWLDAKEVIEGYLTIA